MRNMNNSLNQRARKLVDGATDNIFIQLFRYTFVGGLAFIADFGSLWLLTEYAGWHYQVSACTAFVIGLTVNYLLSIRWVFASNGDTDKSAAVKSAEFLAYAIIGIIGLGLNSAILWLFTEAMSLHYLASKLISTTIVFAWNFLARRELMTRTSFLSKQNAKLDLR